MRAFGGGFIAHDQRNAGVAQCVESHGDRQSRVTVEGGYAFGGNSEFIFQIESAPTARQLDDIRDIGEGLEPGFSVLTFHQARDVFVEHALTEARGNQIDKLIALQNAADVAIIEDVLGSGQA